MIGEAWYSGLRPADRRKRLSHQAMSLALARLRRPTQPLLNLPSLRPLCFAQAVLIRCQALGILVGIGIKGAGTGLLLHHQFVIAVGLEGLSPGVEYVVQHVTLALRRQVVQRNRRARLQPGLRPE